MFLVDDSAVLVLQLNLDTGHFASKLSGWYNGEVEGPVFSLVNVLEHNF